MSVLDDKWMASDYMDCDQYGVITDPSNFIVIGTSVGLTREMAEKIAAYHNNRVSGDLATSSHKSRMGSCLYNVSRCPATKPDDQHSEECEALWAPRAISVEEKN